MTVETKVINLYGGPGTGKSSTASDLFAKMKWEGESVELVQEFAKDLTWDGHFDILSDQLWVSANQNRRLQRLAGKVEYIITDSPLLLCHVYAGDYFPSFLRMIEDIHDHNDNIEIMLNRVKPYVAKGRSQNASQAAMIDTKVRDAFAMMERSFDLEIDATSTCRDEIYTFIKQRELNG